MRIPSFTQPWATLVAISAKKIETRSWRVSYRGEIAIHAAKSLTPLGGKNGFLTQCSTEPFHSVLTDHMRTLKVQTLNAYMDEIPVGAIVAAVDLVECRHTNGQYGSLPAPWIDQLSDQEKAFGNYGPNRYGWFFENIRKLKQPVPCKGAQGLRNLSPETESRVREQL